MFLGNSLNLLSEEFHDKEYSQNYLEIEILCQNKCCKTTSRFKKIFDNFNNSPYRCMIFHQEEVYILVYNYTDNFQRHFYIFHFCCHMVSVQDIRLYLGKFFHHFSFENHVCMNKCSLPYYYYKFDYSLHSVLNIR